MIDTAQINAECIHTIKIALECLLGAGLLTFLWVSAPYWRGPRR